MTRGGDHRAVAPRLAELAQTARLGESFIGRRILGFGQREQSLNSHFTLNPSLLPIYVRALIPCWKKNTTLRMLGGDYQARGGISRSPFGGAENGLGWGTHSRSGYQQGFGMKAQDFCSPRHPRLGSCGCPGPDSAPRQPWRRKAAHCQLMERKTLDGLLLVALGEPPRPGTPPSQLVFQVGDSFLELSQSLIFAVVLAPSRQTSASSASVFSRGCCLWLRGLLASEKSGWPWVFSARSLLLTLSASAPKPCAWFSVLNPIEVG